MDEKIEKKHILTWRIADILEGYYSPKYWEKYYDRQDDKDSESD